MKLAKLLQLSAADYLLLIAASISVCAARLALLLLPFRVVSRLGERAPRAGGIASLSGNSKAVAPGRLLQGISPQRVAWAVAAASRLIGRQRVCLVRALAARWMLAALGRRSVLRIGVAKTPDGKFSAHAWLESQGEVVVGGAEAQDFTPLPPLARNPSQSMDAP